MFIIKCISLTDESENQSKRNPHHKCPNLGCFGSSISFWVGFFLGIRVEKKPFSSYFLLPVVRCDSSSVLLEEWLNFMLEIHPKLHYRIYERIYESRSDPDDGRCFFCITDTNTRAAVSTILSHI